MSSLRTHARRAGGLLVVLAVVTLAVWPDAVEVDLTSPALGPLEVTIDEEGETRVRERFLVSAPVAGRLQRIDLEPGDPIERERTVLARLTPAPPALIDSRTQAELAAAVDAAEAAAGSVGADRNRVAATLERARASLTRQQGLAEAGAVSLDPLETAETAVRLAEEALRAAEFSARRADYDLQMARARLQQPSAAGRPIEIRSPIDGVVLKRYRESEAVVPAGGPLVEVGDSADPQAVADLLSSDAVRVSPGDPVRLEQWGGGMPLEGRVRRIEPSGFMKVSALGVEEQRVNVIVEFADPAAAGRELGDGYRVEVRVIVWQDPRVLKVPVGSLFRRGESWAVFVVENGRARAQVVEIGQRNGVEAEVRGGLSAGDTVVLHPPDTLQDGMRVTARE